MKVPQLDLVRQYQQIKSEVDCAISSVLESGIVIMGENVRRIEGAIADYTGNQFGIGVANGSDALFIALKAL
ncbi:MAG: DegT/DnrJ/EryC1/StrS family aminotransferase, partial [Candidatus Atribacteria bacterium]|nr:DegT/DnrJ/EryC1/StrS family aminotransferase [Candidatus Atribacteria bacterium]